jgi:hypothetical protein
MRRTTHFRDRYTLRLTAAALASAVLVATVAAQQQPVAQQPVAPRQPAPQPSQLPVPPADEPKRPVSNAPSGVDQSPAAEVSRAFAELAHRDPAVREAALARLLRLPHVTLPDEIGFAPAEAVRRELAGLPHSTLPILEAVVRQNLPLAPAQAAVLKEIVTQVFLSGEPYAASGRDGFLGVRLGVVTVTSSGGDELPKDPKDINPFDPAQALPPTTGVVIFERMPGFCGAQAFQEGDVVLGIAERTHRPIRTPQEMKDSVQNFGAGQTVHFEVLRRGQIILVAVRLDPRPDAADVFNGPVPMQPLLEERARRAAEYWDRTFAPLLKEQVS